jgi:PIN domain nuclease of toxin-antitoxin system
MIFLDTHSLLWLYQKELDKFSPQGLVRLEVDSLYISPAVLLELEYLYEIKRIIIPGKEILRYLEERLGIESDPVSFLPITERALKMKWTKDPFDRLITAQAAFHDADLLTKDKTIAANYSRSVW